MIGRAAIRPYRPQDEAGIVSLRAAAFPSWPAARRHAWSGSAYAWLAASPEGARMRRWVVDAGDRVIGHVAAVPQAYRVDGRRVVAWTPTELMIEPGYGFHALALMRTLFRECPDYVGVNTVPEATAIEARFGAEPVGGLRYEIKALDIARHPDLPRRIPGGALRAAAGGVRAADRILLAAIGHRFRVERIDAFDDGFDRLLERVVRAVPCVVEKDARFLQWRYGPGSPHAAATVLAVRDGDEPLGYAVVRTSPELDGQLLDLTVRPGRRDVARALVGASIETAWAAGAWVLRYWWTPSPVGPSSRDLRALGFLSRETRGRAEGRPRHQHTLMVHLADPHLQRVACDLANWSYALGDGESGWALH